MASLAWTGATPATAPSAGAGRLKVKRPSLLNDQTEYPLPNLDALFSPYRLNALDLPNRAVMAPMSRAKTAIDIVPKTAPTHATTFVVVVIAFSFY